MMNKKRFDEAICFGDALDSRALAGPGERTLLLAPGAVIMSANGTTIEAFREYQVLWWALLMILSQAFQKFSRGLVLW